MMPLIPLTTYAAIRSKKSIHERAANLGEEVCALDDYLDLVRKGLERWKSEGAVGIKMASRPYSEPDRSRAAAMFDKLTKHEKTQVPQMNPLYSFLMEEMLEFAADLGLVVAVHTRMWSDFRTLDP